MSPTLLTQYKEQIVPALKKQFGYTSDMQVPRIHKVVLNIGYGKVAKDKAFIEHVERRSLPLPGKSRF